MKTMRWVGALMVVTWCVGSTVAATAEERVIKLETKPDGKAHRADTPRTHAKEHKININEASKTELMTLEGVGAGMAQKIIAHREAHGPFKRAHDLEKVEGLGKHVLEKNAGRITVK